MQTLNQNECNAVLGGSSSLLNVHGCALFVGVIQGSLGLFFFSPVSGVVGFGAGLMNGAFGALIINAAADFLTETTKDVASLKE